MKIPVSLAILLLIITCSCNVPRFVYVPPAQNVPHLEEEGDSKLAVNYSSNFGGGRTITISSSNGTDIQGAFAVTDNFAVQANYNYRVELTNSKEGNVQKDSNVVAYRRHSYEIAAGYYESLGNDGTWFQIFGGVGLGRFRFTDKATENGTVFQNYYEANIARVFIQPAILHTGASGFGISVSTRVTVARLKNINTDYDALKLDDYGLALVNNQSLIYIEPTGMISYAFTRLEAIRFEMQLGFCFRANNYSFIKTSREGNFSFGVMADLPKLLRKKKK